MGRLALLHRVWGLALVVAFLGTGAHMHYHLPPPEISNLATRMLARSAHIYLLLSGLINLALGTYLARAASRGRRRAQAAGSLLLVIGPVLILIAFFYEPPRASLERPLTLAAVISLLTGTLLHFLSSGRAARTTTRLSSEE